jgi:predicted enzyme related to lactoylglutathione lyase
MVVSIRVNPHHRWNRRICMSRTPVEVPFEGIQPILRVEDMQASLQFYVEVLGFSNAPWGTEDFTSVNRPEGGIYLCRRDQGRGGAWLWIGVDDVETLHEQLKERGVAIRLEPTNYPWALEMHVEDPDGNVLRFGSDPK